MSTVEHPIAARDRLEYLVLSGGDAAHQLGMLGHGTQRQPQLAIRDEIHAIQRQRQAHRLDLYTHPRTRVQSLVHLVIDEARVPPHRDALSRGVQVCFRCD